MLDNRPEQILGGFRIQSNDDNSYKPTPASTTSSSSLPTKTSAAISASTTTTTTTTPANSHIHNKPPPADFLASSKPTLRICSAFLKNSCKYGSSCKFLHDSVSIKPSASSFSIGSDAPTAVSYVSNNKKVESSSSSSVSTNAAASFASVQNSEKNLRELLLKKKLQKEMGKIEFISVIYDSHFI